jgi:hypothetical protein
MCLTVIRGKESEGGGRAKRTTNAASLAESLLTDAFKHWGRIGVVEWTITKPSPSQFKRCIAIMSIKPIEVSCPCTAPC